MTERNRLHNCTNPNQGRYVRTLCVCSAGLLRSPTAARVLAENFNLNTRAVGCVPAIALIQLDPVHLAWADEVVCMDTTQQRIIEEFAEEHMIALPPIIVLNIPDNYDYMDAELQELILERYTQ